MGPNNSGNPGSANPGSGNPESANPGSGNPESANPVIPGSTKPESVTPERVIPGPLNPGSTNPMSVIPGSVMTGTMNPVSTKASADLSNNRNNIYWQSPEAKKLFGFAEYPGVDVVAGLEERIDLLKKVNLYENGYILVLLVCAENGDNYVSNHNKFSECTSINGS